MEAHTDRYKWYRDNDRQTGMQTDRHTGMQTDRQTDRQTGMQTYRQVLKEDEKHFRLTF